MTRTLAIIPTVLVFSSIYFRRKLKQPNKRKEKVDLVSIFPWFIVLFVLMAVLNTFGLFSSTLVEFLRMISRFSMVAALAAIGLKTDLKSFSRTGWKPFIHSILLSSLVAVVSYVVVVLIIG